MGRGESSAVSLALAGLMGCGAQYPNCPSVAEARSPAANVEAAPDPAPAPPAQSSAPPAQREKVAVLPFQDGRLFRAERASLRELLANELARKLPTYEVLPLATADHELASATKAGARCAADEEAASRRAFRNGFLTTSLIHVLGFKGRPGELWVEIRSATRTELVLQGPWNSALSPTDRYRAALAALVVRPSNSGGLDLVGGFLRGGKGVSVGPLELCEHGKLGACTPETQTFADRAPAFTQCFAGVDEAEVELLFEPAACELANLDDTGGAAGQREQCLCGALRESATMNTNPERRTLSLHFIANDLVGKPRPELRVLEATANLHTESDRHDVRTSKDAKAAPRSVQRLGVAGLDDARVPLARCAQRPGTVLIADLTLNAFGAVEAVRFPAAAPAKASASCIETALKKSTWACAEDGKSAGLRLSLSWET